MVRFALGFTLSTIALISAAPIQAKTALEHELSVFCPGKKTRNPDKTVRYSQVDLTLDTISVRYDPKNDMTLKDIQAGRKPPVVTPAMIKARRDKAYAEFGKVLSECQTQHDWTDEERSEIGEFTVAWASMSEVKFALFSPPEEVLFNQYSHRMQQPDFQALADNKFKGSPLHKAVIADLKATDWYKQNKRNLNLDDAYFQGLIVDAYYNKLVAEVMRGRFKESAQKRFPG